MTPELQTLLPVERAIAADTLEALLDQRLEGLAHAYDERWRGLPWPARDWLREVLAFVLCSVRQDVVNVLRALLESPRVH